jgi:catechol 2,3-dioxygenase-like lactoylglutathione lyase family enzyme
MSVRLNHTIVWCRDQVRSAGFLTEILGLPRAARFGPFLVVELANGVSLDFHDTDDEIAPQHYAFLVGEDEFDAVFGRIRVRGLEHWADPGRTRPGQINRNDGGRGVYFLARSGRPPAGDHHAPLRQRRLMESSGDRLVHPKLAAALPATDFGVAAMVLAVLALLIAGGRRLRHFLYLDGDPLVLHLCGLRRRPRRPVLRLRGGW